jgi:hypothetical protein
MSEQVVIYGGLVITSIKLSFSDMILVERKCPRAI